MIPRFNLLLQRGLQTLGFECVRIKTKRTQSIDPIKLATTLIRRRHLPTILQCGAHNGNKQDPLCSFLAMKDGYEKALLVEPQPLPFAELSAHYGDHEKVVLENAAVGDASGSISFFVPRDAARNTEATTRRASLRAKGYGDDEIIETLVPCSSLSALMLRHSLSRIDLLVIDCEGDDAEIITSCLSSAILRLAIFFEISNLDAETLVRLRSVLDQNGYARLEYDYDALALHKSLLE